tara:strand:+ start:5025 stop:6860 length:1836 start_codon:yes stop_codon:yes gene_type:complete
VRYRAYAELDDPPLLDGDEGFSGFVTRLEKSNLAPGELSEASNVRLDKGTIRSRKSAENLTNVTRNRILKDNGVMDAIAYNDGVSEGDQVLFAGSSRGYLASTTRDGSFEVVSYPTGFGLINEAKLLQTSVSTILFSDPGVSLNFLLTANSTFLGNPVLRYDDSVKRFKYFKEQLINVQSTPNTFTTTEPHSFSVGELIRIDGNAVAGEYRIRQVNDRQIVVEPSDTQSRPTWVSATGGLVYSLEDQCPSVKFATWAGNRTIIPAGNDDILVSSPLSTHDFPTTNRLTIGSSDSGFITALEPLQDDSLVVFKNNSVYLVTGIFDFKPADQGGSLSIIRISDQIGCVNSDSVQVVGQEVVFLSTQGIYALTLSTKGEGAIGLPPQAVRVTDLPMSRDIQDKFERSFDFENAQLQFWKGRIYLLNETTEQSYGDQEYPGTQVFVYNTLFSKFESIDNYARYGKKLIPVTNNGSRLLMWHQEYGLLDLEKHENTEDEYNGVVSNPGIRCFFSTRGYRHNTFANKHFKRVSLSWEKKTQQANDQIEVFFNTENPESSTTLIRSINSEEGTFNQKMPLRQKGESSYLTFGTMRVQFEVKRLALEATEGSRQTFNFN